MVGLGSINTYKRPPVLQNEGPKCTPRESRDICRISQF